MPPRHTHRTPTYAAIGMADVVYVPVLGATLPAVIDRADFDRIIASGVSDQWVLNRGSGRGIGFVRAKTIEGRLVTIARLVSGVTIAHRPVRYVNGNPLDIRKANLRISVPRDRRSKTFTQRYGEHLAAWNRARARASTSTGQV